MQRAESDDDVYAQFNQEEQVSSDEEFANIAAASFAGAAGGAAATSLFLNDPDFDGAPTGMETRGSGEPSEMVEQSVQTDKWEPAAGGLTSVLVLVGCCCLVLIALAITLPLVLIDDESVSRVLTQVPSPSPTMPTFASPTRPVSDFLYGAVWGPCLHACTHISELFVSIISSLLTQLRLQPRVWSRLLRLLSCLGW
jgi:hypothetical protein